jgi:hypothetical protein
MMVSNLYLFFNYFTAEKLLIAFILLGILFRIYYLLDLLDVIKSDEIKNKYLRLWRAEIIFFVGKLRIKFYSFFEYLTINYFQYNEILFKVAAFLHSYVPSKVHTVIILFVDVFSKVIVVLSFLIDIFYFKQLSYFYKTVGLLLLPVVLYIIKASLLCYHKDKTAFIFATCIDSKPIEGTEYHEFCFKEGIDPSDFDDDFESFFYLVFCPIFEIPYMVLERYKVHDYYNVDWISLSICIIYFLGGSYMLLTGIKI